MSLDVRDFGAVGDGSTDDTAAIQAELRRDVRHMSTNVEILVSQDLDERLNALENWRAKSEGKSVAIAAIVSFLVTAGGLLVAGVALIP
jgi:hypothetical protein